MEKLEKIKEVLENMSDYDLFSIWNEYARENCYDDEIFELNEDTFNEICSGMTASDIAMKIQYGNFNFGDDYFVFNGYANFDSGSLSDFVYIDDLARYIEDNEETFDNDELEEIFDEEEI